MKITTIVIEEVDVDTSDNKDLLNVMLNLPGPQPFVTFDQYIRSPDIHAIYEHINDHIPEPTVNPMSATELINLRVAMNLWLEQFDQRLKKVIQKEYYDFHEHKLKGQ